MSQEVSPSQSETETSEIQALFLEMLEGWDTGDGRRFAAPFADTVDFVGFDSTHITDRKEIETIHQELFDKWLRLRDSRVTPTR